MRGLIACLMFLVLPSHANALDLSKEPLQPLQKIQTNAEKVALGKQLFFDARLSRDHSVSCAHCHNLEELGGADGLKHSFGVDGREGLINSPTVFNAALNLAQFWDGRATTLEKQMGGPITGHAEMDNDWQQVVKTLSADSHYPRQFSHLYSSGISEINIKDAIAEFERSLITTGSRFDRYLMGDENALSEEEKQGYQTFKAYGCVACHQGRNVGGNLFQKLGVIQEYFADYPEENKAARGRLNVTGQKEDLHFFKVPSLRLAVLTAPYLHNGSGKSLAETIRIMAKYQLGRPIPDEDLRLIISFLYTLPGNYNEHSLEPKDREQLNFTTANKTSGG